MIGEMTKGDLSPAIHATHHPFHSVIAAIRRQAVEDQRLHSARREGESCAGQQGDEQIPFKAASEDEDNSAHIIKKVEQMIDHLRPTRSASTPVGTSITKMVPMTIDSIRLICKSVNPLASSSKA